jgi:hypothetical protein
MSLNIVEATADFRLLIEFYIREYNVPFSAARQWAIENSSDSNDDEDSFETADEEIVG